MIKKEGEWRGERELQGSFLSGEQCECEDRLKTGVGTWCEEGDGGTGRRKLPEGKN